MPPLEVGTVEVAKNGNTFRRLELVDDESDPIVSWSIFGQGALDVLTSVTRGAFVHIQDSGRDGIPSRCLLFVLLAVIVSRNEASENLPPSGDTKKNETCGFRANVNSIHDKLKILFIRIAFSDRTRVRHGWPLEPTDFPRGSPGCVFKILSQGQTEIIKTD